MPSRQGRRRVRTKTKLLSELQGRVWLDALACDKTFVASVDCRKLERLIGSLHRDIGIYGRAAILDMYRQCYLHCKEMEFPHFAALDPPDQEDFAWDIVFLNACRDVLHNVPLTLYAAKPARDELRKPKLAGSRKVPGIDDDL